MSKPTEEELKTALIAATRLKESDSDKYFVAKSLLNLNFRMRFYEELLHAADLYMNHGQSEHDRMQLLSAINKVKEIDARTANMDIENFGLE